LVYDTILLNTVALVTPINFVYVLWFFKFHSNIFHFIVYQIISALLRPVRRTGRRSSALITNESNPKFSLSSYLKFEFWWNLVEFVLLIGSLWLYGFYAELFSNFHAWYRQYI